MTANQYDPRIAMVAGYRPPRPKIKNRRWPKRLAKLALSVTLLLLVLVGIEAWLAHDPIIPRIDCVAGCVAEYRPKAITRLLAPTGEVVGEIAPARRRLLSPDRMPQAIGRAVVARLEPDFFTRPPLGQRELFRALVAHVQGKRQSRPLTVQLVHSMVTRPPDEGVVRLAKEWITAMLLEHRLSRADLLHLYLNEVPFGRDALGAAEGARNWFGKPLRQLDDKQIVALADIAGRTEDGGAPARAKVEAERCGALAIRKLGERYDADGLAHLGADVATSCEPALTRAIGAAIAHSKLGSGLVASAIVMRLPGQEVVALAGDVDSPRPIGPLRAPFVLAAALASLKYSMISKVEPDSPPLRTIVTRSLLDASDGLVTAGLSKSGAADQATRAGITSPLEPDAFAHGDAAVTPSEVASALSAIGEGGLHRLPQVIRSVGGVDETDGAKAGFAVMPPEVAYLVANAMQIVKPSPSTPSANGKRGRAAWNAVVTPDGVVVVSIVTTDGTMFTDDTADKAAAAIARDVVQAAFHGKPKTFSRPRTLVSRRIDATGQLLPLNAAMGTEEWFVAGSLPRYEPPPDEPRDDQAR